jgi:hypothetical protein
MGDATADPGNRKLHSPAGRMRLGSSEQQPPQALFEERAQCLAPPLRLLLGSSKELVVELHRGSPMSSYMMTSVLENVKA